MPTRCGKNSGLLYPILLIAKPYVILFFFQFYRVKKWGPNKNKKKKTTPPPNPHPNHCEFGGGVPLSRPGPPGTRMRFFKKNSKLDPTCGYGVLVAPIKTKTWQSPYFPFKNHFSYICFFFFKHFFFFSTFCFFLKKIKFFGWGGGGNSCGFF